MKLTLLAQKNELLPEPLLEDIPDALGIDLPQGLDTELADKDINRILACAGWERLDGGEHEAIVPKEYEQKHKRAQAAKKAAVTRENKKIKAQEKVDEELRLKQEEELRKHEEELARREHERQVLEDEENAKLEAEAKIEAEEAAKREAQAAINEEAAAETASEEIAGSAVSESLTVTEDVAIDIDGPRGDSGDSGASGDSADSDTSDDLAPSDAPTPSAESAATETKKAPVTSESGQLKAIIQRNLAEKKTQTGKINKTNKTNKNAKKATKKTKAAPAPVVRKEPSAFDLEEEERRKKMVERQARAEKIAAAAKVLADARIRQRNAPDEVDIADPSAFKVSAKEDEDKNTSKMGSKLASIAKLTADRSSHKTKDKDIKELPTESIKNEPDSVLSSDQRRILIQDNIKRNLDMANRVKGAKERDKRSTRKPGFRSIDNRNNTSAGGPNRGRGPGGPGGGPMGGGPGGGPGGPNGPRRHGGRKGPSGPNKKDQEGRQKSNKRTLTTDEIDLSEIKEFAVSLPCSVREFSEASGMKTNVIIAKLFMAGIVSNVNSNIERDAIDLLAAEFEKTVTIKAAKDIEEDLEAFHTVEDTEEDLSPRPPVVTVLGHVDHGKTSLIDAIRKTKVTATEAGGITQHIGSYTVTTATGMEVTFIDTPGHEAFTEMRARGAKVTDVAVIVIAADDGVMPQTIEAINHAKAAGVSIIIAMNKVDKDGADAEKIYRQLSEQELISEAWGGDIAVMPTVATTGQGIDELLERLALETEVLELRANHFAEASGTVIEAHMSEGRGIAATLLVQRGSLAAGDIVAAGTGFGRVRNMTSWNGSTVTLAGPSHSVEIIGLSRVPTAGDSFHVVTDLKKAAEIADQRLHKKRDRELRERASTTTMASIFDDIASSKMKEFKVLVKADTSGSLEVLKKSLKDISNDEIRINILHAGVGCITTGDVTLAEISKAVILGFHVVADPKARSSADSKGVDIQSYTIIYELLDVVKAAVTGMLDPEMLEKVIGHAEVRQTFRSSKVGTIAGLYVTDGKIIRDAFMRITRDGVIVHEGKVSTLRRFKEDVKEVRNDYECGLTVEKFHDIKNSDIFEFYQREAVARTL